MDTSVFFRYDPNVRPDDEVVFLAGCTQDDWRRLSECGEQFGFRTGDVVIQQGRRDRSMLIVLDGRLQTVVGTGRRQRKLSAAPTGSVIGKLSFLDGGARSASVIAETDGEALRLDFDAYESLRESHPELAHRILLDLSRILVMRLRRLTTTVAERN